MSAAMSRVYTSPPMTSKDYDNPSLFKRSRTWWTLLALCLLADGNGFLTKQDNSYYHQAVRQRYASSPLLLIFTIALWAIVAALISRSVAPILRTMLKQKALLALLAFVVVSALWSEVPLVTLRKALLLSLTFAFAWFFASYYSPADQRRMLLATGTIMAFASLVWIALLPSYGVATAGEVAGEWKGVFGQKNELGISMVAFFSLLPFRRITDIRKLFSLLLQSILPILLVVKAHSRESLIFALLFVGVRILGPLIARSRREHLPFFTYVAASVFLVVFLGWQMLLSFIGVGAVTSWTGRLHEWDAVMPYIRGHFWLGYGYGGFWTGQGGSLKVMNSLHVALMGSDSGYTDNMLSFGMVGMMILLIVLLVSVRDFLQLLRRPTVPIMAFWYVAFTVLTWVEAVVGNTFPVPSFATTFIFVVACCGLTNMKGEEINEFLPESQFP